MLEKAGGAERIIAPSPKKLSMLMAKYRNSAASTARVGD